MSPAAIFTPPIVVLLVTGAEVVITRFSQVVLYKFKLVVKILDLNVYPASNPKISSFEVKGLMALVKFK